MQNIKKKSSNLQVFIKRSKRYSINIQTCNQFFQHKIYFYHSINIRYREFLRNAIEYKQIQIHDCHNYY